MAIPCGAESGDPARPHPPTRAPSGLLIRANKDEPVEIRPNLPDGGGNLCRGVTRGNRDLGRLHHIGALWCARYQDGHPNCLELSDNLYGTTCFRHDFDHRAAKSVHVGNAIFHRAEMRFRHHRE